MALVVRHGSDTIERAYGGHPRGLSGHPLAWHEVSWPGDGTSSRTISDTALVSPIRSCARSLGHPLDQHLVSWPGDGTSFRITSDAALVGLLRSRERS